MKKASIIVDSILPIITTASGVVTGKNSLKILDMIRLEFKNEYLYVYGSDGETFLTSYVKCDNVNDDIDICVDTKDFVQSLRGLTGKNITLEIDESKMLAKGVYDNGHFIIPFSFANEYPIPSTNGNTITLNVSSKILLRAISLSEFAIANDDLRPIMNGINFDFFNDKVVLASSDGQKLVKYTDYGFNQNGIDHTLSFVLARKPAHILTTLLQNNDNMIEVRFDERNVTFRSESDGFNMQTLLICGKYPNYNLVIPTYYTEYAIVDRNKLMDTLKRVLPFGSDSTEIVVLNFADNILQVKTEDIDFSKSAEETLLCEHDSTIPPFRVGFKGSLLIQILQNMPNESVKILYKENNKAVLFVPNDTNEQFEYLSLLMPLKLND